MRRIRSNSWHAREKVSGPEAVATNKEQLLARPREGERAGQSRETRDRWAFFSSLLDGAAVRGEEERGDMPIEV